MAESHYIIVSQYLTSGKKFREYDKRLKKYPEIYNSERVSTRFVRFHRRTGGRLLKLNPLILRIAGKKK